MNATSDPSVSRPGTLGAFLLAEPSRLLCNLVSDLWWHFRADVDERDEVVGEAELDVPAGRQSPFEVPAHAQLDEAVEALDRGREDVPAEV